MNKTKVKSVRRAGFGQKLECSPLQNLPAWRIRLVKRMTASAVLLLGFLLLSMKTHAAPPPNETHTFTNINITIPDGNAAGLSSVQSVTSVVSSVTALRVKLRIDGQFNGDLYGYLRHVTAQTTNFCVLLNRPGRSAANAFGYADSGLDVTLADDAVNGDIHVYRNVAIPSASTPLTGTWQTDGRQVSPYTVLDTSPRTTSFNAFFGANGGGEWTLFLADLGSGATNRLLSWELQVWGVITPSLTWATPADITYGTALSGPQLNATATFSGTNVPGTFAYSPAPGTVLDSGSSRPLSVIFTPTDTATFQTVSGTVSLNVAKAPLTARANNTARLYGGSNPSFSGTIVGVTNGDAIAASYACSATTNSPVGTYAIVPNPAGTRLTNYVVSTVNGTLTVSKAPLTASANAASRTYGDPNPSFTGSITGVMNGETITATYGCPANQTSSIGSYAITPLPTGLTLTNYDVTTNTGTLLVTAAALAVSAQSTNRLYGTPNPVFTGTIAGVKNSETITASYSSPAIQTSPVGAYPIVPSLSGTTLANYTVITNNGTLTLNKAASISVVISTANPAPPGQSVTFTCMLSAVAPSTGAPGGFVQFRIDGSAAGSPVALSSGAASYTTSSLAAGTHAVVAEYAGDGNFLGTTNNLAPDELINSAPVAALDTIECNAPGPAKILIATLMTNDFDPDGNPLSFISVSSTSTNSGTVTRDATWVYYTPPVGKTNTDAFTYTISDSRGAQATGTVLVLIKLSDVPAPNLTLIDLLNGSFMIRFDGVPLTTYRIQFATNVPATSWFALGTSTADGAGRFEYTDTPPNGTPKRYYRSVYP